MVIIVEKKICSLDVVNHFLKDQFDAPRFFQELKLFLIQLVTYGYYNTDIKLENLCYDHGEFLMIDLDPNYVKPIQRNVNPSVYVDYMLFQTYICMKFNLIHSSTESVTFHDMGMTEKEYTAMLHFVVNHATNGCYEMIVKNTGNQVDGSKGISEELHEIDPSLPQVDLRKRSVLLSRKLGSALLAGITMVAAYKLLGKSKKRKHKM
jgi:hypothetical protein